MVRIDLEACPTRRTDDLVQKLPVRMRTEGLRDADGSRNAHFGRPVRRPRRSARALSWPSGRANTSLEIAQGPNRPTQVLPGSYRTTKVKDLAGRESFLKVALSGSEAILHFINSGTFSLMTGPFGWCHVVFGSVRVLCWALRPRFTRRSHLFTPTVLVSSHHASHALIPL